MELALEVKDAAGAFIDGAEAAMILPGGERRSGVTDGQGRVNLGPVPNTDFQIKVVHPLYIEDEVGVIPPRAGGQFLWDNPVWTFTPQASINVRLSRIRAVPLAPMSDEEMKLRASYNPQAVYTWVDHAGNRTQRYLGLFNEEVSFVPVTHPLIPEKPAEGWGRFNHGEVVKIAPNMTGNFIWLEWGTGGSPRLLVAVWVPRWRVTPGKLDYTIFFTPSTFKPDFPDAKDYPYMAVKTADRLVQPYVGLGHRYLFNEKWLSYQLLAAKRQSVLVVPIHPKGQWGPFAQAAGLSRLLAEITHYLHRTGLTSGGQSLSEGDRAPGPNYRFGRMAIQLPPPAINRIVLSGFSAGVGPIVNMLPSSIGQRLNDRSYSVNGVDSHILFGADTAPFLQAWKEVWDHDAPAYIRGNLDERLPKWMRADSGRMARCYQTDYTGSQKWLDHTPMRDFVSGRPLRKPANGLAAAEIHAEHRCSLVYFSSRYLKHAASAAKLNPVFWTEDEHQAVPMFTFMHAALLSGLSSDKF